MPTNTEVTLVPIDPDGTPRGWPGPVPDAAIEKLRFRHVGIVDDPEDGTVWEWRLAR